mgnify:CR=1 FL=1
MAQATRPYSKEEDVSIWSETVSTLAFAVAHWWLSWADPSHLIGAPAADYLAHCCNLLEKKAIVIPALTRVLQRLQLLTAENEFLHYVPCQWPRWFRFGPNGN